MEVLDRRIFGITILLLWATLVLVKRWGTGSLLRDRPHGGVWIWAVHVFNFSFLLVANPAAAILLMASRDGDSRDLVPILGAAGVLVSGVGYLLLAWALLTLRRNFQVCGNPPRASDELVMRGPYRLVRHPMYTGAVCIALGLACLTQSLAFFSVFCVYVVVVLLLIPVEERDLRRVYGEQYAAYEKAVKRLVPSLY